MGLLVFPVIKGSCIVFAIKFTFPYVEGFCIIVNIYLTIVNEHDYTRATKST